jgi:hypothetical protein
LRWNNVYAATFTGNLVGQLTGASIGNHKGNVLADDNTEVFNAVTKQLGYPGANIVGTLVGSVTGSAATATNANKLNDLNPSVVVLGSGVASIPVRDADGNI